MSGRSDTLAGGAPVLLVVEAAGSIRTDDQSLLATLLDFHQLHGVGEGIQHVCLPMVAARGPVHEHVRIYVDSEHILRTDHILRLWSAPVVRLHYKLTADQR